MGTATDSRSTFLRSDWEDSRFDRRGDMTSISNWSERTDSTDKSTATTTGLGASPSQTVIGDEFIAENSDIFREAITARKNLRGLGPQTHKCKTHRSRCTALPPGSSESRVKNKPVVPTPSKNQEAAKPAAVPPPPPTLPARVEKGNEASIRRLRSPKQLVRKARSPRSSPPPSPTLLPRLLLKTRVWKEKRKKWGFFATS
ncbi:hypothetical protein TNCV_1447791 [Trichonephila clavipes]|nr:hypothetical protein TNCV_1447791 [Trichonephila clavipes]